MRQNRLSAQVAKSSSSESNCSASFRVALTNALNQPVCADRASSCKLPRESTTRLVRRRTLDDPSVSPDVDHHGSPSGKARSSFAPRNATVDPCGAHRPGSLVQYDANGIEQCIPASQLFFEQGPDRDGKRVRGVQGEDLSYGKTSFLRENVFLLAELQPRSTAGRPRPQSLGGLPFPVHRRKHGAILESCEAGCEHGQRK